MRQAVMQRVSQVLQRTGSVPGGLSPSLGVSTSTVGGTTSGLQRRNCRCFGHHHVAEHHCSKAVSLGGEPHTHYRIQPDPGRLVGSRDAGWPCAEVCSARNWRSTGDLPLLADITRRGRRVLRRRRAGNRRWTDDAPGSLVGRSIA